MKLAHSALFCSLFISASISYGQNSVGIGVANPNKNAVLELISPNNNQGILIPKLTTAQRTAASFTSGLGTKENGLLVFDSTDSKFYYWNGTQWKELGTGTAPVPQDLQLVGSTLTVTNNPSAVPINLSDINVPQDIKLSGSTLTVTNNPSATPINLSDLNIPQDLQLTGSTLTITNNPSATPINLGAFTGTNTDDQTLAYTAATGVLSISRITGGPQTVTLTTAGTAGGDLTGTYPNPTVNNNAITSAKIADGTVASADITDGTVASIDITDNSVASADIFDGTIVSADIADASIASIDIFDGAVTSADILDNTVSSTDIFDNTIVSADILDGAVASVDITDNTVTSTDILDATIASIDIATGGVASADILDATIINNDIADGAVQTNHILDSTIGTADIATGGVASVDILDGTIVSTDIATDGVASLNILDGTVTSTDITDGTIANADVSGTAAIAVSKLAAGTNGQILATSGGLPVWSAPGASALISAPGTLNLVAGSPMAGVPSGFGENTFYGANAGNAATTGAWNVAVGSSAGQNNVTGTLNTLVGWRAGFATTAGSFNGNTFIGAQAGQNSISGPSTFIGEKAGQNNSSGTLNVFVGNQTGLTNTTGAQITLIGYQANVNSGGLLNATALGYQAIVDANNKVRIGNTSVTVIEGAVAFTNASDRRLKSNIKPIEGGLDFIMKLRPVSYNMKNSVDHRTNWGFIAQEIESIVGSDNAILTKSNNAEQTLGLRYTDFVAPLVKAVQEQQDQISDLNNKLSESEKKYDALAAELEKLKRAIGLKAEIK